MVNKRLTQLADRLGGQELEKEKTIKPASRSTVENLEDYIILPGRQHGSYEYPDLLVAKRKLDYAEARLVLEEMDWGDEESFHDIVLRRAVKDEVNTKTTTPNPNGYLAYITWDEAQKVLFNIDAFMLTPRQYVDFLNLLDSGKTSEKIYDGEGSKLERDEIGKLWDGILTLPAKSRTYQRNEEWLDASFRNFRGGKCIDYTLINDHGILLPHTEVLFDYLDEARDDVSDENPGPINLLYWLKNATKHGLPPKREGIPHGGLNYWPPANRSVVSFGSRRFDRSLCCVEDPTENHLDLGSSTGVRVARLKE